MPLWLLMLGFLRGIRASSLLGRVGARGALLSRSVGLLLPRQPHKGRYRYPLMMLSALSLSSSMGDATSSTPTEYFRKDYTRPNYLIPEIYMSFAIDSECTIVTTTSTIVKNSDEEDDLVLDGEDVTLLSVSIDGSPVAGYSEKAGKLTIPRAAFPGRRFELTIQVELHPSRNLALSGLYASGQMLCTQCEAMGFRRIAYHLDRPDVLSRFRVRMSADSAKYPILLSNGNLIDSGVDSERTGAHWTLWEDPFPKPCYLFALVAGDLGYITDTYNTKSGRSVRLGIYSDKDNVGKLSHAMYSLKESMRWDEDTFGLECDLDLYNIVASNDFNMGAMENKGLNIFNSAFVLADPATATDSDYERVLGVIAHEYFHNWTGNRVTVRDWFQLTLKEGLTVFRDQWFSSDVTSHAVKRIEDVRALRSRQFAEDSGPMSHPIRPDSYISMDNFYTGTVYVKGAEVVRMYRTMLGEDGFKKGMVLYFARHDGQAVTCEDFRNAMADANGVDLTQFERWYSQAGTPVVDVTQKYDAAAETLTLTLRQQTPATPGQSQESKLPLMIPVVVGLVGVSGKELAESRVLLLTTAEQSFVFEGVSEPPIPSVLRDFSAPVKVRIAQSNEELSVLMAFDKDSYNRWEAGHRLSSRVILELAALPLNEITEQPLSEAYVQAMRLVLESSKSCGLDLSLIAYAIQLPDLMTLSQEMAVIDPERLHLARSHVKQALAKQLYANFREIYDANTSTGDYRFTPEEVSRRRLRNTCLDYLTCLKTEEAVRLASHQFASANCMSDKIAAISSLVSTQGPERDAALAKFHDDAKGDALVINKWFSIQAMGDRPRLLDDVKSLKAHPEFILSNPNRARSLIGVFAGNLFHFHAADGQGYAFLADCVIEIDKLNPQVAARMAGSFSQWRRFDPRRQELMRAAVERVKGEPGLSKDTFEVCLRTLK